MRERIDAIDAAELNDVFGVEGRFDLTNE